MKNQASEIQRQEAIEDLPRVFISYSRSDQFLMNEIADSLRLRGYSPDFDQANYDKKNIDSGISAEDEWWVRIQEMIAVCEVMIFLVSPVSVKSKVCDEEIAYARAIGKRIVAVKVGDIDFRKASPHLAAMNVKIDFTKGKEHFEQTIDELCAVLSVNLPWLREGRKLAQKLNEWTLNNRLDDFLLRGKAIYAAQNWVSMRPVNEEDLGVLFHEFLNASQEYEERLIDENKKRIAEKEKQLKRISRLQVLGSIGILVFLFFVIVISYQSIKSLRGIGQSESTMLAKVSQTALDNGNNQQGLRLAIFATKETFLNPSNQLSQKTLVDAAQKSAVDYHYVPVSNISHVKYIQETNDIVIEEMDNNASGGEYFLTSTLNLDDFSLIRGTSKIKVQKSYDDSKVTDNFLAALSGERYHLSSNGRFSVNIKSSQFDQPKKLTISDNKTGRIMLPPKLYNSKCEWKDAMFSPDSKRLLIWSTVPGWGYDYLCFDSNETTSYLLDLYETDIQGVNILPISNLHVTGSVFSPDTHSMLVWGNGQQVEIWDLKSNTSTSIDRFPEDIMGANFSSDGHLFTIWGRSTVNVYETSRPSRFINSQVLNSTPEEVLLIDRGKHLAIWNGTSLTIQNTNLIHSPFSKMLTLYL